MPVLLFAYAFVAFVYASLCGIVGKTYHPLLAYTIYALALTPGLAVALIGGRIFGFWPWRRLWPPTGPETRAAVASVLILTVSTLVYLSPQSMIAILIANAGCLLLVARREIGSYALVALSVAAVFLSILHKPLTVAFVPIIYGLFKILGYWVKISSIDKGKAERSSQDAIDFLAAEQVLVSGLALAVAGIFAVFAFQMGVGHGVATRSGAWLATDWRLWAIGLSSLGMGLLSTRIMLRLEPTSLTFPAYKMVGLLAALSAAVSRGELTLRLECWPSWVAATLACVVVALTQTLMPAPVKPSR